MVKHLESVWLITGNQIYCWTWYCWRFNGMEILWSCGAFRRGGNRNVSTDLTKLHKEAVFLDPKLYCYFCFSCWALWGNQHIWPM